MATFTIIIPHKNTPDLLVRCLNSIPDIEEVQIIVVDDNSSSDIVDFEHFPGKDRKFTQVIFDKEAKGAGHARNVALPLAKGRWLMFADADDLFVSGFYDTICRYKDASADLIIFTPKAVMSDNIDAHSSRVDYVIRHLGRYFKGVVSAHDTAARFVAPWSKMIRHSFVQDNRIIFEEIPSHNDVMFSTQIACLSQDITITNETIYIATQRGDSLSLNWKYNKAKLFLGLSVYVRANRLLRQRGLSQRPLAKFLYYGCKAGFFTFIKVTWILISNNMLFSGLSGLLADKEMMGYAIRRICP